MSFEWENGRILKKINTSDKSVQMSYDSNGMRTQKSVDGVKTNYYYDSNKNLIALIKGNDTLLFYYDSEGSATSFSYNGTMYFYVKNLQGDVIRIIDLAGTEVASYVYDAWGNIKDTKGEPTIREINPIRYRGYVYDTETSLYYLQSRYYDPFAGRFLNADVYADTQSGTPLSTNMFAYCDNNSISMIDNSGKKPWYLKRSKGRTRNNANYFMNLPTRIGAKLYLRDKLGWKYSARFLEHATNKHPSTLSYSNSSDIAKDLKKTSVIKNQIKVFKKSKKRDKSYAITFTSGDFFGAFYHCTLICKKRNGKYTATLYDIYDFKLEWGYYKNAKIMFANNYAWASQLSGALNKYKIYVYLNF